MIVFQWGSHQPEVMSIRYDIWTFKMSRLSLILMLLAVYLKFYSNIYLYKIIVFMYGLFFVYRLFFPFRPNFASWNLSFYEYFASHYSLPHDFWNSLILIEAIFTFHSKNQTRHFLILQMEKARLVCIRNTVAYEIGSASSCTTTSFYLYLLLLH